MISFSGTREKKVRKRKGEEEGGIPVKCLCTLQKTEERKEKKIEKEGVNFHSK